MTLNISSISSKTHRILSKNSEQLTIENLIHEFASNHELKSSYHRFISSKSINEKQLSQMLNQILKDKNLWHNYLFISNQIDAYKSVFDPNYRLRINNLVKLYFLSIFLQKSSQRTTNQYSFFESFKLSNRLTQNNFKLENFKRVFEEAISSRSSVQESSPPLQKRQLFERISKPQLSYDTDKLLIQRVYNFSQDGKNLSSLNIDGLLIDHLFSFFYNIKSKQTYLDQEQTAFTILNMLNIATSKLDILDRFIKANRLNNQCDFLIKNASLPFQFRGLQDNQHFQNCLVNFVKLYVAYQYLKDLSKTDDEELSNHKFFRIKSISINPIQFAVSIDQSAIERFINFITKKQIESEAIQQRIAETQRLQEARQKSLVYHPLTKKSKSPNANVILHPKQSQDHQPKIQSRPINPRKLLNKSPLSQQILARNKTTSPQQIAIIEPQLIQEPVMSLKDHKKHRTLSVAQSSVNQSFSTALDDTLSINDLKINNPLHLHIITSDVYSKINMSEESIYCSVIKNFKQANVSLENNLKNPQIVMILKNFLIH